MKEIFYLNKKELPTLPSTHDYVIKEIKLDDNMLKFIFEDDVTYHDGANRDYKTLSITYYFLDNIYDISMFKKTKACRLFNFPGVYKEIDLLKHKEKLINLANNNLEYLYQNIGYQSIIISLYGRTQVILDITAKYIEYDWK